MPANNTKKTEVTKSTEKKEVVVKESKSKEIKPPAPVKEEKKLAPVKEEKKVASEKKTIVKEEEEEEEEEEEDEEEDEDEKNDEEEDDDEKNDEEEDKTKDKKPKKSFLELHSDFEKLSDEIKTIEHDIREAEKQMKTMEKKKNDLERQRTKTFVLLGKSHDDDVKKALKVKPKRKGNKDGGFNKELPVPPKLMKFLDIEEGVVMSRPKVMSLINEKFKSEGLKQGQITTLDAKNAKLLGKEKGRVIEFTAFQSFLKEFYDEAFPPQNTTVTIN
jgi:hypothetical protein